MSWRLPQQEADQHAAALRDAGATYAQIGAAVVALEGLREGIAATFPIDSAIPIVGLLELLDSAIDGHRKVRDQL